MKSTEMLNQIKTLLNIEVKLEEMKLENGTLVEAESFEKGKEIFIKTDDEKVAMPVGEYILEDGRLLIVEEEGIIADMRDVSDEVPQKEEGKEETEDMYDKEKKMKDDEKEMADEGNYVTKDSFREMEVKIQNLEDAISDLKGDKESKMEDVEEEMSKDAPLKSRTVKEEFSDVAVAPIKHSPEKKSTNSNNGFNISPNRIPTVLDRVLARLNK
jgi:hypothetical protein